MTNSRVRAAAAQVQPKPVGLVSAVLDEVRCGRPVIVIAGTEHGLSGSLVVAAELVTASSMAFVVRHTSGFVCVALSEGEADRLELPPMVTRPGATGAPSYAVTVDAGSGISTGISARDRAFTARVLADRKASARQLRRPGHLVPVRTSAGGVLERLEANEAAVDLMRLAGLAPAAVVAGVVSTWSPTKMCDIAELRSFAARHSLAVVSADDVLLHRRQIEVHVERTASASVPLDVGSPVSIRYRGADQQEHLALIYGSAVEEDAERVLHVHGECIEGDVFGATNCRCADALKQARRCISSRGSGVIVYVRGDPAPSLTSARSHCAKSGLRVLDEAQLVAALHIVRDLGLSRVRLLECDLALLSRLQGCGVAASGSFNWTGC